ncbi:MAG: membrane integrity-associated transporter subunit PqiC [Deltaproteobacteria bacterium]|nr:membrane integrity-associated transporter subunit PqiC [Deltaproteobacteria bacterium]MBW2116358.1 membrane integrity-associated transporter subunit PqiC [Deltaproteobacteria bacterium]MBW2342423.1 membrane integrity-associated transporter subunit PqiC [Deltaproteobacteria bacterium]
MPLLFLRIRIVLFLVLAGSFLCSCITTSHPATRFYVLNPLDPGVSLVSEIEQKGALSVEVASLRLPQYLERPQIVTRCSKNRLELSEYRQWGGNLRKNMMRVLARNLSRLLASPHIAIYPHRPTIPPDFRVELEVMQFERDPGGQVRLSAQWRLSSGKNRKPLTTRITDLASPVSLKGGDFEHTVAAMSKLFGELSQIIGSAILEHVHGRPGS